jgi:hypothetical protein
MSMATQSLVALGEEVPRIINYFIDEGQRFLIVPPSKEVLSDWMNTFDRFMKHENILAHISLQEGQNLLSMIFKLMI